MRTLIVFETAKEFFNACNQNRLEGDDSSCLPSGTTIVSNGSRLELQGDGTADFSLCDDITIEKLTEEAFRRLGASVYFT